MEQHRLEDQVWNQLDRLQHQQHQPKTAEVERLRDALARCPPPKLKGNSLQHECRPDTKCDWFFVDSEWAVCTTSANLHCCTVAECAFRDDAGGERMEQKGHGGYSVCMLTARAREQSEYVQAGWVPYKRPSYSAKTDLREQAGALIKKCLDSSLPVDQRILGSLCTICARVWDALESKACDFEAVCVWLLVEMAQHGIGINVPRGGRLVVVPPSGFLKSRLPTIEELIRRKIKWTTNISKNLYVALPDLGEPKLRGLADEFRRLLPL